ncbi:MAG: hypothetical protein WD182_01320 [Bacteroidota bacterium]
MRYRRFLLLTTALAAVLTAVVMVGPDARSAIGSQPQVKKHDISILKIKNRWKVVSATGDTVKAKRGEQIVWTAVGSDMYFQFMDDKLFGGFTRKLKAGQKLNLPVATGARRGVNAYAVFCLADKEFATGDSPPIIIIE